MALTDAQKQAREARLSDALAYLRPGPDAITLRVSQRFYLDYARFTIKVDGVRIPGVFTARAGHDAGQSDTLTLHGSWGAGQHTVEIEFLNDAYGGTWDTDRNLYVEGIAFNGTSNGSAPVEVPNYPPTTVTVGAAPAEFASTAMWADEFLGTTVNTTNWTNVFDGQAHDGADFYWRQAQVSVSGGMLHIGIQRRTDGNFDVGGLAAYTNAGTGRGFGFLYGRVEIRAKASQEQYGAGPCFLIWPEKDDHWPPEVDILETPLTEGTTTLHWQGPAGNNDNVQNVGEFSIDYSQWHTYSLEWTPTRLTTLVDGNPVKTWTSHIPTEKMSVGLMGYVGAPSQAWYGTPDSGFGGLEILVEYVRVYAYTG